MELFKKVGFYEICIKILEGNNSIKSEYILLYVHRLRVSYNLFINLLTIDGTCTPNLDAFINRSNQVCTERL